MHSDLWKWTWRKYDCYSVSCVPVQNYSRLSAHGFCVLIQMCCIYRVTYARIKIYSWLNMVSVATVIKSEDQIIVRNFISTHAHTYNMHTKINFHLSHLPRRSFFATYIIRWRMVYTTFVFYKCYWIIAFLRNFNSCDYNLNINFSLVVLWPQKN